MYTIIGGDGREYGPVSAAQVRTWISGGRANQETKVKALGTDTWRTVADFPELTDEVPPLPPSLETPAAYEAPEGWRGAPRSAGPLDIISCYERSWELLKANFWPFVGAGFLLTAVLFGLNLLLEFLGAHFIATLIGGPCVGGTYAYMLRRVRGQASDPRALTSGFGRPFVSLVLVGIVGSAIVTIPMALKEVSLPLGLLSILPAIYLAIAYTFAYICAVDRGSRFWSSLETSRRAVSGQWWRVCGLVLLGIPFALLGLACLIVGIFVVLPLVFGATLFAYEDLIGGPRTPFNASGS